MVAARASGAWRCSASSSSAWRLLPNEFIAVTGTNGKTTTTELLGAIHRDGGAAGRGGGQRRHAAGARWSARSIPTRRVVCEASSFQLEDTEAFAPEAAVLLNLAEDHLDRHGTLDAYRAAKLRLFAHQDDDDVAVFPRELALGDLGGCARRLCFGDEPQASCADGPGSCGGTTSRCCRGRDPPARAPQPRERDGAPRRSRWRAGVAPEAVARGAAQFAGVPHRLEEVGAPRRRALRERLEGHQRGLGRSWRCASFDGGVHAILGGRRKGGGFAALRERARGARARPST